MIESYEIKYHRLSKFFLFVVVVAMIGILIFGITSIYYKHKYDNMVLGCAALSAILVDAQQACMDYSNLTNDKFQEVYFDWSVNKIKTESFQGLIYE